MTSGREPRGIRNHNPGNVRRSADKWMGLSPNQTDRDFFQFKDASYGLRALVKLLQNYERLYGLKTVKGLINRWAPPVENNTSAYVNVVAKAVGVAPDAPLDLRDRETMTKLLKAIVRHENGIQPYPDGMFMVAMDLAGMVNKNPEPVKKPVEEPKVCPSCGRPL